MKQRVLVMSFGSDAGGIEKSLIEFLKFLVAEEKEVDLYLWRKPGILYSHIPKEVNIIKRRLYPGSWKEFSSNNIYTKISYTIWYLSYRIMQFCGYPTKVFCKFSNKYNFAIAYCQNGYSPYYIIDKVQADKKYIWYHHGAYEKTKREENCDYRYYKRYDRFITVSNSNEKMLLRHFPLLKDKIQVIKNLVNENMVAEKSREDIDVKWGAGYRLVTVGRIAPEKGQKIAIEAARILKERNFKFIWIFIGSGPELMECRKKVQEYNLNDCCMFIGEIANPYPYMKQADMYIQPSKIEADPITIQEAKILKKPIIASNIPAIKETLENGRFGLLCECDSYKFADAICYMASSKDLKVKYINNLKSIDSFNNVSKEKIRELFKDDDIKCLKE